jgi:hypothetical protein
MDLRAEILKEHSKQNTTTLTNWVGSDKKRMKELMNIFLRDEYRVVQRAAWVVSSVAEQYPELIKPYLPAMVKRMCEPGVHVAVKRNVVRVLQFLDIPEDLHGETMNVCFNLLADPKETIAVRCFSMTVLDNLSKQYPDIRQELVAIIEDQLQHEPTAGFISRAKKVLKNRK